MKISALGCQHCCKFGLMTMYAFLASHMQGSLAADSGWAVIAVQPDGHVLQQTHQLCLSSACCMCVISKCSTSRLCRILEMRDILF